MRRLVPVVLAIGCVRNYVPTLATAPGADELLFTTTAFETEIGGHRYLWGSNSLAIWMRMSSRKDWFIHGEGMVSFYAFPVANLVVGFGKAWEFQGGYLFSGVDVNLASVWEEGFIPYVGVSVKDSQSRLWATIRPGVFSYNDLTALGFWSYPAAQMGLTMGERRGAGFFVGAGIQDTLVLWRAGFYLFKRLR